MNETLPTFDIALAYHRRLPKRIQAYLAWRGIPRRIQERFLLGWDGRRITIPIYDREGRLVFFRLARDPRAPETGPKMLAGKGGHAELYGWENLRQPLQRVIVCEGEFDRLVLEARGFTAITSTGGAGVFRQAWADRLADVPLVYLCFDRDVAGKRGALRVAQMVPHAQLVELPEAVGRGGDVTDFFVRLKRGRKHFRQLLLEARPAPAAERLEKKDTDGIPHPPSRETLRAEAWPRDEIERLKAAVPIQDVVGTRIALKRHTGYWLGLCPFHDDQNPSLVVYENSQRFHCFGCLENGDVISFLMRVDNLSFPEALRELRRLAGNP